jgi:hypothetical protein
MAVAKSATVIWILPVLLGPVRTLYVKAVSYEVHRKVYTAIGQGSVRGVDLKGRFLPYAQTKGRCAAGTAERCSLRGAGHGQQAKSETCNSKS